MTFIWRLDLVYLKILTILMALMKVVEAPKSTLKENERAVDIMELHTMRKSKRQLTSLKNAAKPNAIILNMLSKANIIAKP